jgi:hypothetical protein
MFDMPSYQTVVTSVTLPVFDDVFGDDPAQRLFTDQGAIDIQDNEFDW